MIEQAIRDLLRSSSAIRNRVDGRVFAGNIPRETKGECVIVADITSDHSYHLGGEIETRESVVQITCYAAKSHEVYSLAELLRNRLSGFSGTAGVQDPITIVECTIANNSGADVETPQDSSDKWVHSYTVDYAIFFETSVPTLT